ncbi:MAG TPA: hypothetical protein VLY24_15625 [Bryobacteraceae bacterium]|nr:hypothetical protein [Bryobacteraceae bacterium]
MPSLGGSNRVFRSPLEAPGGTAPGAPDGRASYFFVAPAAPFTQLPQMP